MNTKAVIPLVLGLAIAGVAAKLGLDYVKKARATQTETISLWTPVQDIPRGESISQDMVKPLKFPANCAPPGAVVDVEQLVGRVPHTGAPAGVPVLETMLMPPGTPSGLIVPEGYRAVAVKVDESSGVDNHLIPGCRVDVVGMFSMRSKNRTETMAKTILEDVEVAAVGQRLAPPTPDVGGGDSKKSSKLDKPARAVTLLVRPTDVPTLHLAEQRGKLKLSMRGTSGLSNGATRSTMTRVTEDALLGDGKAKADDGEDGSAPGWSEQFGEMVQSFWGEPKPAEAPDEPAAVAAAVPKPQKPEFEWQMVIYNGDDRRTLGWSKLDSYEPVDLTREGPNLFQDSPDGPGGGGLLGGRHQVVPGPTPRPRTPGDMQRTPVENWEPFVPDEPAYDERSVDENTQPDSEPEELAE